MKKLFTLVFGLVFLASPMLAFAQTWQTVAQLTAITAALEAQQASVSSGQSLACAAVFSTSTVQVGQPVAIAWGSVGAIDPLASSSSIPMWSKNGSANLSFTQVGTWTYSFTFYSASNASTTCSAKVSVTK